MWGMKLKVIDTDNSINYIEESIDTKLRDLGLRKDFMNLTPKAGEVKAKNK